MDKNENIDVYEILITITLPNKTQLESVELCNKLDMIIPEIVGSFNNYWSTLRQIRRKTTTNPEYWSDLTMSWTTNPD